MVVKTKLIKIRIIKFEILTVNYLLFNQSFLFGTITEHRINR